MKVKMVLALLFWGACSTAIGQTHPFIGKWTASWAGEHRNYEAMLAISQTGGTWKTLGKNKLDNCVGLEAPIAIQSATSDAMTIQLNTQTPCKDAQTTKLN